MTEDVPIIFRDLEESPGEKNVHTVSWLLFLLFFILFVTGIVTVVLFSSPEKTKQSRGEIVSITPSPTPSPHPAYKDAVDLSEYSLLILNASDSQGEEGRIRDLLEGEGFAKFELGEVATTFGSGIRIERKSAVTEKAIERIVKAIGSKYTVSSVEALPPSDVFDIRMTIGSEEK